MLRKTAVLAILALFVAPGCAHKIYVLGEPGPEHPGQIAPGTSVWVRAATPSAADPEADREIARKIEMLLDDSGYEVATESAAEVFLFFEYVVEPVLARTHLEPLGGVASGMKTVRAGGPFHQSLSLWLVDAALYRELETEKVVWLGGAAMGEAPTASPRFLNLMLVIVFKHFPKNSGGTLKARVLVGDSRAKRLRPR